ncbi:UPF0711 protein C18orf21 homolog [Protopterus annectens]|uniref:UPF0711 protein C18orf21 homolog n=1 Tax=Protopterus annectens TaxID=7888 RepID=UPI001CFBEB68|nr:UPF0711 protein C18orf21 homolog [Protopterus annectens]
MDNKKGKVRCFLKQASFRLKDGCPGEARYLLSRQNIDSEERRLEGVCPYCFQYLLPGNHRVRLKPKMKLTPRVCRLLNQEKNRKMNCKQQKIIRKYKNSRSVLLVTCYTCSKTSRYYGVNRSFLAMLPSPACTPKGTPNDRRQDLKTPSSSNKQSMSQKQNSFGSKGKSPATTPRTGKSEHSSPSSSKSERAKKFNFSRLKMLLKEEQKQLKKKGRLQDFLSSL